MPTSETDSIGYAEYRGRRVFANLDGLRALSILAVIYHHTIADLPGLPITGRGFLGVDMFFVLSGFLIVTLLLRERERTGAISLGRFYMRRTLRILPLYLLVLVSVLGISVVRRGGAFPLDRYLDALPYLVTYTSNWVPHQDGITLAIAWSLAAEEQFYLLWPPVERFLGQVTLPVWVALFALSEAINFDVWSPLGLDRQHTPMLAVTFAPILIGVLLAHALHDRRGYATLSRLLGGRHAAALGLTALVLISNIAHEDIGGWHRLSIHVVMAGTLTALVLREQGEVGRLLQVRPLVRMGQISYGMYLWHQIVRAAVFMALGAVGLASQRGLLFIGTLAGVWALSELSFRVFEAPFTRLKARFSS